MAYTKLKTSVQDGIGLITMADPGTLNAAGLDLMDELQQAFDAFAALAEQGHPEASTIPS